MNTYFGSSVAAVDLNNDDLSDLLVGAPLYADEVDEGRVYVYINQGQVQKYIWVYWVFRNTLVGELGNWNFFGVKSFWTPLQKSQNFGTPPNKSKNFFDPYHR